MRSARPSEPIKRADAARNRHRILEAARIAFAAAEGEVSMAEISRRAGVGMATLYRNFASRRELLEALYVDEVDRLCAAASTLDGATAGEAFMTWVEHFFDYFASKRRVAAELLEQPEGPSPVFGASRTRVVTAGEPLLASAQESGEIRADLSLDQILDMVAAIAKIQAESGYLEPILHAALNGLGTGSQNPGCACRAPHRTPRRGKPTPVDRR